MNFKLFLFFIIAVSLAGCSNDNEEGVIEASGNIEVVDVTLSSKIPGEINKIVFEEGAKVSKGDTIMFIDNESLLIQLKQAEASKIMAESQLQLMRKGAREEDIAQAESAYEQAQINLNKAEKDFNRTKELYASEVVAETEFENATTKYDLAKQQLKSARENLEKTKNISRPEEIKQAEAKLLQSIANVDLIKKNIKDSYIVSPIDGFIVEQFFEEGEFVSQMSSLVKISKLSEVELNIYVTEIELADVKLGDKAEVKVDAFPEKSFEGTITYISPESEFTPKNIQTKDERTKLVYKVKLIINNPDFTLKAGMPADAFLKN